MRSQMRFGVHLVNTADRFYLPLPKLGRRHLEAVMETLSKRGFAVTKGVTIVAGSPDGSVRVSPTGYASSTTDPTDVIIPIVPTVLSMPKERVSASELRGYYLQSRQYAHHTVVRFDGRLELGLWRRLRAAGECLLTPDEGFVAREAMLQSRGSVMLVTDFAVKGSRPFQVGVKTYFESELSPSEAAQTLRTTEARSKRNSYLPSNGVLQLSGNIRTERLPLDDLGEWSCLAPR